MPTAAIRSQVGVLRSGAGRELKDAATLVISAAADALDRVLAVAMPSHHATHAVSESHTDWRSCSACLALVRGEPVAVAS
ncbi:hypothetical protein HUA74_02520 [Myxococcus sp. CA051A]|uniref:hypothetical protein n=1 Tax=Myxococcus sp. CA051A TaxID=2741739 RepID=UPI00157B67A6|nr:hypothetical protein [Myxococcus sp. CA051A]NTX59527.1 hypothetical protein [Myxococcus sp. CA051A]